jgi:uncharacterized protein YhaN
MTASVLPLQDLTQQISQRESELERLRQEYEARRAQLAELARRKEELQGQLKEVDAEIQTATRGSPSRVTAPASSPLSKPDGRPRLANFLTELVDAADGPITVAQLAAEVVRRKFPTTSANIPNMVATRVKELVEKGLLRRAPGQPGVLPAKKKSHPASPSPKAGVAARTKPANPRSG